MRHSLEVLAARIIIPMITSMFVLLIVMESEELFFSRGRLDPLYPFVKGEVHELIGGIIMLGAMVLMMMTCTMLYQHRNVWLGACIFAVLSLIAVTFDYVIGMTGMLIGWIAGFDSSIYVPRESEFVLRLQRFGYLLAVSSIGILPAYLLRGVLERSDARRFRRLLKKRRMQKGSYD